MKVLDKIKVIASSLILIILFSGCPGKEKGGSQSSGDQQSEKQISKMSDELKQIETRLDTVIMQLGGPIAVAQGKEGGDNKEQSNKEQGNQQQNNQQQDNQQQDNQQQDSKGQQSKDEQSEKKAASEPSQQFKQVAMQPEKQDDKSKAQDKWQEVSSTLNDLHFKWNDFMPLAAKLKGGDSTIKNFSNSLNNLTNSATSKNYINTLDAANNSYLVLSDFYKLYKSKVSPEIKKIKYYMRNIILSARANNWTQAENSINNLKDTWSLYKTTLSKSQKESGDKLDLSINEMQKVVKGKDLKLTNLKGSIVLTNIEKLEKQTDKDEKGDTSSS